MCVRYAPPPSVTLETECGALWSLRDYKGGRERMEMCLRASQQFGALNNLL